MHDQVPTINVNIDKGIIPDKPSYTITIKDVTFAYPARPDIMVRIHNTVEIVYICNMKITCKYLQEKGLYLTGLKVGHTVDPFNPLTKE